MPAAPNPALLRDYKVLIGSLLFLQTGTIPETSYIVSVLARYMTTAGEPHMAAAKKILRYLQSRKKVFLLNGGAISWRSTKTMLQVPNAAESEIVSLSSAAH